MNKTIVITGAGGVLCSSFAEALAADGAKVALLDLNEEAAKKVADRINAAGGTARAYGTNVLERESLKAAHEAILADLGPCDILINGAGGNNPRCTTAHEVFEPGDEDREDIKTFFNLDKSGFDFVFSLNLMGSLLHSEHFLHERLYAADQDPGLQRGEGSSFQLYTVAGCAFCKPGYPCERNRSRLLCNKSEPRDAV